ncbi:PDZ domain-containing protein [Sulfurimonas sp.]|nr:PDZ domain-containing protein [Sulfurimonas sp.]
MLRLFIALNILFLNLYACKGGYESCKLKSIDSSSFKNNTIQIPVKNNQRLIYSKTKPNFKIIKHDPYLSLYLIKDNKKFKHPFRINNKLSLGNAMVNSRKIAEGRIVKHQVGLNKFATYSEKLIVPSILTNSCCALEGIVTPDGIIEKEYIDRFLDASDVSYADIGIRVIDVNKLVIVDASNPFMSNNPFVKDDCILEFDGKKVKDSSTLMKDILFSKIGSSHKVKVKRGSKILTLHVSSKKRSGGGYLSDTFLEFLGLSFDDNLYVTKIETKALKYQLILGDRLLEINGQKIETEEEILNNISDSKSSTNILFQRRGFQFFIAP